MASLRNSFAVFPNGWPRSGASIPFSLILIVFRSAVRTSMVSPSMIFTHLALNFAAASDASAVASVTADGSHSHQQPSERSVVVAMARIRTEAERPAGW